MKQLQFFRYSLIRSRTHLASVILTGFQSFLGSPEGNGDQDLYVHKHAVKITLL